MRKAVDLTDREFGKLKVIEFAGRDKYGNRLWKCRCECEKITVVRQGHLLSGHTTSCGCTRGLDDYTGRYFNYLYVKKRVDDYVCPGNGKHYVRYLCECECGKETIVLGINLRNGTTKSCGCKSPHRFQDLSGKEFGNLKVIRRVENYVNPSGRSLVQYLCECKCGNQIYELADTLRNDDVHSCGCLLRSRGEDFVKFWLSEHGIAYDLHKTFPDCLSDKGNKLSYDFWIPSFHALIECNGLQHYEPVKFFGGEDRFVDQQRHDELKRQYAESKSYYYLVLDCRHIDKSDFDDLLNEFICNIKC